MERTAQTKLLNEIFKTKGRFEVRINVWFAGIEELKRLLSMGHVEQRETSKTIFSIKHEILKTSCFPAVEITFFCNEAEAKFMQEYMKGKEVKK